MSTQDESADIINAVAAEPTPAMPVPLDNHVTLLRGLMTKDDDGNDIWHSIAEVRELNGEDEEALATLERKEGLTYTEYMNALLERAVVKIGDLVVEKLPGIMGKLILADRDMLFLGVVRATYGSTRDMQVVCPKCQTMNDVQIDLTDDFPITKPTFDLMDTIKVQTKNGVIQLRLPNGEDTVFAQKRSVTDPELNTAMLSRCAVWEKGEAPADPIKWAKSLNIGDRRKLVNTLLDIEYDMPIMLDWVSLLLS